MTVTTISFKTAKEMAAYLNACIDETGNDPAGIIKALGVIAHARGMAQIAHDSGLSSESLYLALSGEVDPEFATILKIVRALGLRLHADVSHV